MATDLLSFYLSNNAILSIALLSSLFLIVEKHVFRFLAAFGFLKLIAGQVSFYKEWFESHPSFLYVVEIVKELLA